MASLSARSRSLAALTVALTGCGGGMPAEASGGAAPSAGSPANAGASPVTAGAPSSGGAVGTAGGVSGSAGESSAGAAGAGGSGGAGMVGVFIAQGHHGRITRSCDDGLTFPYNHSEDDDYRCFVDAQHDCDHSALAGRGLAFGSGSFVATWGWGAPGKLQRTVDGVTWTDVMTETPTFADVAYGNSLFVACGNPTRISTDGMNWQEGGELGFDFNYRGIEFVPSGGGTFIVTGESNAQRAISYSRDGKTWMAPSDRPAPCGQELRGIAGSDTTILIASGQGHVCYSTDGASTWTFEQVTDRFTSPPVWTGTEFWIYAGNERYQSADGELWQSQAITPSNISIGNLARSPQGTIVAANEGWQVWYDQQRFYRSTDGVNFAVLEPEISIEGSHPINFMGFGHLPASSGCGLP